jgi:lipid-binding SYLF domain-containing protein
MKPGTKTGKKGETEMREKSWLGRKGWIVVSAVVMAFALAGGIFGVERAYAKTAKEINASVDVALDRFFKDIKGAKEFADAAKGMLVMPGIKKAAVGIGGEYGEGALRVKGQSVAYYNFVAASYGWQIGAQAKDMIVVFMTDEALKNFQGSKGWEAGLDGNIAVIELGAGGVLDTKSIKDPIVAFVFDVKGLMADISLKGGKFTKLDK